MKKIYIYICLLVLFSVASTVKAQEVSQTDEQFGIEHLAEYLGLTLKDFTFRSDYTEPDSFRLAIIEKQMNRPLEMIPYTSLLYQAHVKKQPEILAGILYSDSKVVGQTERLNAYQPTTSELNTNHNLYYTNGLMNLLLDKISRYLNIVFPKSTEMMLARLTMEERKFLTNEFKEILVTSVDEETMSAEDLDAMEKREEAYADHFVTFGRKVDKDPVISAGVTALRDILLDIRQIQNDLKNGNVTSEQLLANTGYLPTDIERDSYLGMRKGWYIGGIGNDYYEGDAHFIIDLGGDDIYNLSYDPSNPHGVIIIDISGNDSYRGNTDFTIGSGCLSVGLLIDLDGDDRYDSKSFSLGSGYFGFGLLYDEKGEDKYSGDTHVQGAGTFGIGLVIDEDGRDNYDAALYSQGFGYTEGIGMIYDLSGSDKYYAGGKYKDHLRYEDHYLSLSQGFGYGLRPTMSGGIGAIIDKDGNDIYSADIFAQACSYWWSLGMIYDLAGNDHYQCFQYGQGSATHMTLGILVDDNGNDVYHGKGLMQGVGHDYSCGIILDRGGNDTYTAYDLSQAAGSANGFGLLIDNVGDDRYFIKNPKNTQGYGNPRRDFGSIGMFLDLGGDDQYNGNGKNNYYWITDSKWGGGMDIELKPVDSTENKQ